MKDLSPEEHLDVFLRVHHSVHKRLSRLFAEADAVPPSEARVLTLLSRAADHRLRIDALSQELGMTKSALSRIVDRLERDGNVVRVTSSLDRRAIFALITPAGREALRHVTQVFRTVFQDVFLAGLSPQELNLLTSLLGRLDLANAAVAEGDSTKNGAVGVK